MSELESVIKALSLRPRLVMELCETERSLKKLSKWLHCLDRRKQRKLIIFLKSQINEHTQTIGSDGVERLADAAADQLWRATSKVIIPNKNPYGRAASKHFENILAKAYELRDKSDIEAGTNSLTYRVTDMSLVDQLATKNFMRTRAQDRIAEREQIASDTELVKKKVSFYGSEAMIIQHRASGLRAIFILHGDGFGEVSASPSNLESIDPGYQTENQNWRDLLGLGIGRQIYSEGNTSFPNTRWISQAGTLFAERLRQKLHNTDPFIWNTQCKWCEEKLVSLGIRSWKVADQGFFANHPCPA